MKEKRVDSTLKAIGSQAGDCFVLIVVDCYFDHGRVLQKTLGRIVLEDSPLFFSLRATDGLQISYKGYFICDI